jgi:hypothetical protein
MMDVENAYAYYNGIENGPTIDIMDEYVLGPNRARVKTSQRRSTGSANGTRRKRIPRPVIDSEVKLDRRKAFSRGYNNTWGADAWDKLHSLAFTKATSPLDLNRLFLKNL